ncbi:hypothetical protein [Vibrio owensii]|uniref:hypothetical protein n=1 Tax=Vibrio owensii TaxID=696485 RepID=UPI001E5D88F4|nr:hypothetical protein [Vibrio owensii]
MNLPLALSALTLLLGFLLYRIYPRMLVGWRRNVPVLPTAESVFDKIMSGMMCLAKWQTQLLQQKRLSHYVLLFFIVLAGLLLSSR